MNNQPISQDHSDLKFFAALMFVLSIFFLISFMVGRSSVGREIVASEVEVGTSFDHIEITAKAAYVYDSRTGDVLYAKNENQRMPLASLTKVMAALVASELGLQEMEVVVSKEALAETGDSGLLLNERWRLKDLLDFSLTSSSNDGMKAVALSLGALSRSDASNEEITADFVAKMNEMADTLGMKNTYYWNVTGLDETEFKGGAYGTAHDMALLFDYVLRHKPALLEATKESVLTVRSMDNFVHTAKNTGYIVTDIPGIKASKTGYTDIAGGNLVVAFDPEVGRPIIVSVLGSTAQDRFSDVLALMRAAMESINTK